MALNSLTDGMMGRHGHGNIQSFISLPTSPLRPSSPQGKIWYITGWCDLTPSVCDKGAQHHAVNWKMQGRDFRPSGYLPMAMMSRHLVTLSSFLGALSKTCRTRRAQVIHGAASASSSLVVAQDDGLKVWRLAATARDAVNGNHMHAMTNSRTWGGVPA